MAGDHSDKSVPSEQKDEAAEEEREAPADVEEADLTVSLPAKKRNKPDVVGGGTGVAVGHHVDIAPAPAPAVVIAQAPPPEAVVATPQAVVPGAAGGGGVQQPGWRCPLCDKGFESEKAMFGHLRVHKNKPYKGAFPPPTFNPEGSPDPKPLIAPPAPEPRPEAQTAATVGGGGGSSSSSSRPRRNIDLNKPFREEDDEA